MTAVQYAVSEKAITRVGAGTGGSVVTSGVLVKALLSGVAARIDGASNASAASAPKRDDLSWDTVISALFNGHHEAALLILDECIRLNSSKGDCLRALYDIFDADLPEDLVLQVVQRAAKLDDLKGIDERASRVDYGSKPLTLLQRAAGKGWTSVVSYLLKTLDFDPTRVVHDSNGKPAGHIAVENGHVEVAVMLMQACSSHSSDEGSTRPVYQGLSMLEYAVALGQAPMAQALIKHDTLATTDKAAFDEALKKAAMEALCRQIPAALSLLDIPDVAALSLDLGIALLAACMAGKESFALAILDRSSPGLKFHLDQDGQNAMHHACGKGLSALVHALLPRMGQSSLNTRDKKGQTPFLLACQQSMDQELPCQLLKQGAEPAAATIPVMKCTAEGGKRTEAVSISTPSSAVVDSPLHSAIRAGNVRLALVLLETGSAPDVPEAATMTRPLQLAVEAKMEGVVWKLLQLKADPNVLNNKGESPLLAACAARHVGITKLLLNHGAHPDGPTLAHDTWPSEVPVPQFPLGWALETWNDQICCLLLDAGASWKASADGDAPGLFRTMVETPSVKEAPLMHLHKIDPGGGRGLIVENDDTPKGQLLVLNALNLGKTALAVALLARGARIWAGTIQTSAVLSSACACAGMGAVVKQMIKRAPSIVNLPYSSNGETALHTASEFGRVELLAILVDDGGANVNSRDNQGRTPLHLAALRGDVDAVKALLVRGADASAKDFRRRTPLHVAAAGGRLDVVTALLEVPGAPDANARDAEGLTPLCLAVEGGHHALIPVLAGKGRANLKRAAKATGESFLRIAVKAATSNDASVAAVRALLGAGCDPNECNDAGNTVLHLSVKSACAEATRLLLEAGALTTVEDFKGRTALHEAVDIGSVETAQLLLSAGADPNVSDSRGRTPLHDAIHAGHGQVAALLINSRADVNARDESESTPLHIAVQGGREKAAWLKTDVYNTSSRAASRARYAHMASLLIGGGAEVDARDPCNRTPLQIAVYSGHEDMASLLIESGANVNVRGEDGKTPLIVACEKRLDALVDVLLEKGANVNFAGPDKKTPLILACGLGMKEVAQRLILKGADIWAKDGTGQSAFDYASKRSQLLHMLPVLLWLIEKGYSPDSPLQGCNEPTLLYYLCSSPDKEQARLSYAMRLLDLGARTDVSDRSGATVVFQAIANENAALALKLLERGGDGLSADIDGWTPLHMCCHNPCLEVAVQLVALGADVSAVANDSLTPLHLAIRSRQSTIAAMLIRKGANVNVAHSSGQLPLHVALFHGMEDTALLLLEAGSKADAADNSGRLPVFLAAVRGMHVVLAAVLERGAVVPSGLLHVAYGLETLKVLVEKGNADIHVPNRLGSTLLYSACARGKCDIALYLLQRGANPDILDEGHGRYPLHALVDGGGADSAGFDRDTDLFASAVTALVQAGASAEVRDNEDRSALHRAAEKGYTKLVRAMAGRFPPVVLQLNEEGFNDEYGRVGIDHRDSDDMSALMHAVKNGHVETVEALLAFGACWDGYNGDDNMEVVDYAEELPEGTREAILALLRAPREA